MDHRVLFPFLYDRAEQLSRARFSEGLQWRLSLFARTALIQPALLLGVAMAAAVLGVTLAVYYSASRTRLRRALPLSAGLLLGVALFGVLPEIAADLSWALSLACFAAGFLFLTLLDRAGVAICPSCAHDHSHHECNEPLHGFAGPTLIAVSIHALFDGWAIAATGFSESADVRVALPLALVLHKIPEGLALGGILKPALPSRWAAVMLATAAESLTMVGGAASLMLAPRLGSNWTNYPLALAGGFFLFLAFHALHGEWKRSPRSALIPALAGMGFSAILQTGLRSYLRF